MPEVGSGTALGPDHRALLAACDLLRPLPPAAVDDLLRVMTVTVLAAGEAVFPPDAAGRRLWVVLEGRVGVSSGSQDRLLAVLERGDALGEMQVFDPLPWTFSAHAMTRAVLASARREDVLPWVARHPSVAVHLLERMAHHVAEKSRAGGYPLAQDASVRVARAVLLLADRYTSGGVVQHGLTQQQLADIVGLSRERVNKALGELADRHWLRLERGRFVVLDRGAIEEQVAHGRPARCGPTVDLDAPAPDPTTVPEPAERGRPA